MRYTRQPQTLPSVDTSNVSATGLGSLVTQLRYDALNRRGPSSVSGTVTFTSGKFGVARSFARASSAQEVYSVRPFSGDFTIFLVGGLASGIASSQLLVSVQAGGTARFWLGENSNNNMSLVTSPSGGSTVSIGTGGTGDAVYVGRLSGTTLTLWKDGVQVSTGTQSGSNWSDVTGLNVGNTAFLANPGGNVYAAGFASRAWSDAEIIAFSQSPWSLYRANKPRTLFAPPAAGGDTAVTCTVGDEQEAGLTAAVSLSTVVSTAIYTETEAGPAATVSLSTIVAATVGAEAEAGLSAAVSLSTIVAATVGDEQEAGLTATVASATNISLSVANENESGIITAVSVSTQVNCVIGIETEAGLAMTVTSGTMVLCTVGDEQEVGLGATITTGGGLAGATPWYQLALRRGKR